MMCVCVWEQEYCTTAECVLSMHEPLCKQVWKRKTIGLRAITHAKKEIFLAGALLEQKGRWMCWPAGVPHVDESYRARDSSKERSTPTVDVCPVCVNVSVCVCVCECAFVWVYKGPTIWWECDKCVKNVWVSLFVFVFLHPLGISAVYPSAEHSTYPHTIKSKLKHMLD